MFIQSRSNVTDLLLRTHSAVRVALIEPAVTFTNSTASSSGGGTTTTLTSAGAHGLTAAVAVGASIFINGGTGWTAGFYTITALDSDTTGVAITINIPYSAGFGTPTVILAGSEVSMASITIPPLSANSYITTDLTWGYTSSANGKVSRVRLGGFAGTAYQPTSTTPNSSQRIIGLISNRNATNSQLGTVGSAAAFTTSGTGTSTGATITGSVDTSVSTLLVITATPAAANEIMALDRYIINVWR